MLDALRILSMIAWAGVAAFLAPSAWRALAGETRAADHFRAALFFVALLMIGFAMRWYLAPADRTLWTILYLMNCVAAVHVWRVARAHSGG